MPNTPKKPEPPKRQQPPPPPHQHKPLQAPQQQPHATTNIKPSMARAMEPEGPMRYPPIPSGVPSAEEMGIPKQPPAIWREETPPVADEADVGPPPDFIPITDLTFADAVTHLKNGERAQRVARWGVVLGPDDVNAADWQTAPAPTHQPPEPFDPIIGLTFNAAVRQLQGGNKVRRASRWGVVLAPDDYAATDWQTAP